MFLWHLPSQHFKDKRVLRGSGHTRNAEANIHYIGRRFVVQSLCGAWVLIDRRPDDSEYQFIKKGRVRYAAKILFSTEDVESAAQLVLIAKEKEHKWRASK